MSFRFLLLEELFAKMQRTIILCFYMYVYTIESSWKIV